MSDIDLTAKASGRIIWQYRNGAKFRAWIGVLPDIASSVQDAANRVANLINVDEAEGDQLDICGRIAGAGARPRINSGDLSVFAYNGTPGAQPYGEAPYKDPATSDTSILMPDYLYRTVVKAKITKNNSLSTIDEVKEAVDFIIGSNSSVVDNLDMSLKVWLDREISANVRYLIDTFDIIPRPQGVKLEFIEAIYPHFGYAGTPTATGYGQAPYFTLG